MNLKLDDVLLEINTLKPAKNVTFAECAEWVMRAFLLRFNYQDVSNFNVRLAEWLALVTKWAPLLTNYIEGDDSGIEMIFIIVDYCVWLVDSKLAPADQYFAFFLKTVYDLEFVSEDSILQWYKEQVDAEGTEKVLVEKAKPLIDWLNEAEEYETDSEDES